MTSLTSALLDSLRSSGAPGTWPAILGAPGVASELETELARHNSAVQGALIEHLGAGDRHGPAWARAALWVLGLAGQQGATADAILAPGLIRMVSSVGVPFVVAPLAFQLPPPVGADEDIQRLTEMLDGAIDGHRYTLHLRKPLPSGLDVGPIAQAVHLWLAALRRGADVSQCAAYEDDDVSIEIGLTGVKRREGSSGLIVVVEPGRALRILAQCDSRLMHAASEARTIAPGVPLISFLAADGPWKLPRGYVNQVLYGTPKEVNASSGEGAPNDYDALYAANGLSLMSDPACSDLAAVWWGEPSAHPLGVAAWSHLNPWASSDPSIPVLPGRRFMCRRGPIGSKKMVLMGQIKEELVHWGPAS